MTGLEKIVKHIEEESSSNVQELILKANETASQIIADAQKECEKIKTQLKEKSDSEELAYLQRAESAASLQKKKMILSAKQQMISEVLEKAKESLVNLKEEDYFQTILKMLPKHVLGMDGEIVFSKRDHERLPNQFVTKINEVISHVQGASLKISEQVAQIEGGFLLKYGDIEENCSFEALIAMDKDNLQDNLNTLLFEEQSA